MRDLSLLRRIVKEKLRGVGTEVPCAGIGKFIIDYIGFDGDISDLSLGQKDELRKRLHELWVLGCLIKAWKNISPDLRIENYMNTWSCVCEDGNYELWWEYRKYHPTQQINVTTNISELSRRCAEGRYREVASDLGVETVSTNYRKCLELVQNVLHERRGEGERISRNLTIRFQNVLNDNLWNQLGEPQSLHTVPDLTMFRRGTTQDPHEISTENLDFTEECLLLIEAKHKPLERGDLKQFAFYVLFFKPRVSVLAVQGETEHMSELNFTLDYLKEESEVHLMNNFDINVGLQIREEISLGELLRNFI